MDTQSLWKEITQKTQQYPALNKDIEVDVVIIGGGITGVTAALHLIDSGKKIAIVEANEIGGVTTGFSTGNLYVAVQPYYQKMLAKFGLEITKQVAHSRQFAIDYIEKNVVDKKITCHFSRRPWYMHTDNEKRVAFLEKEFETLKKLDIPIEYTDSLPFPIKFKKAAMLRNQARFNPLQYVVSLAESLDKKNCLIFEKTRALEFSEKDDQCLVETSGGKITAKNIIIATHTPIGINHVQMYTAAYRSYVVAVRLKDGKYPEGHFWDLDHHAVCTHSVSSEHPELLMVAGSHHKIGQEKDASVHFKELEKFLRDNYSVKDVAYTWSAQHYHSADTIPYIGLASRSAKNIYMATGYFADGLIYGTLAGMIISNTILKKENPLAKVYDSNRFTPMSSAHFLWKENSNLFLQYLKDLPFANAKNFDDIKAGDGKVVEIDSEKCGVYRDDNQKLHIVSAVCTHMKCVLHFNNAEKTWDCPCHGSRFGHDGKVIEGPAILNLKKVNPKEN